MSNQAKECIIMDCSNTVVDSGKLCFRCKKLVPKRQRVSKYLVSQVEYTVFSLTAVEDCPEDVVRISDVVDLDEETARAHIASHKLWLHQQGFIGAAVKKAKEEREREAGKIITRTGKERDIDGYIGGEGIRYMGKAYEQSNGKWTALADVDGCLCLVEVTLVDIPEKILNEFKREF